MKLLFICAILLSVVWDGSTGAAVSPSELRSIFDPSLIVQDREVLLKAMRSLRSRYDKSVL